MTTTVVPIREPAEGALQTKIVPANQKEVDALPLNSGMWRVKEIPGLYVRCRAKSKSFLLQRRVRGVLVKHVIGQVSLKAAREQAMKVWSGLEPKPAAKNVVTLGIAIQRYLEEKTLAAKTRKHYEYNADQYLAEWKSRALREVGNDRAGFRFLIGHIKKKHGVATANQVIRLVSAVYRWQRVIDPSLPEPPTTAVKIEPIRPRDWAYSSAELKQWWDLREQKDGEATALGVKTLGTIKRMWWLTALLTGARKSSIESLRWKEVDLEKKTIFFRVAKGDRPYVVPMSDLLAELLTAYRSSDQVPPSEWLFPSPVREGKHIVGVKNDKEGAGPAHRLRHTFRTTLAQLGASPDQARMLLGHSLGGDVSRGYITPTLVVESLRPLTNSVAEVYRKVVGFE
jgi:integrase